MSLKLCRFRVLNAKQYVENQLLHVQEYSKLPASKYAAFSYVWRGLGPHPQPGSSTTSFSVEGAEDADPINSDVLRTACRAALHFGCDLLWIDRLSILQTSKKDKSWQIQNMFGPARWVGTACYGHGGHALDPSCLDFARIFGATFSASHLSMDLGIVHMATHEFCYCYRARASDFRHGRSGAYPDGFHRHV